MPAGPDERRHRAYPQQPGGRDLVTGNSTDCGITVPGHNPAALNAKGQPQPAVAGVYDNVIRGNTVTNNGLKGDGAGVLFANAMAGTACTATWSRTTTSPGTGCLA